MKQPPFLKTERLLLRSLQADDLIPLFDYRNNEACARYQRWEDTSNEYLKEFLSRFEHSRFLSREPEQHYAICLSSGELIGDLAYFYSEKDRCITLGYTISHRHQRKGYAFELLTALIGRIRLQDPESALVGLVEKDNAPSIALLEKLGFRKICYAEKIRSYIYEIPGGSER